MVLFYFALIKNLQLVGEEKKNCNFDNIKHM